MSYSVTGPAGVSTNPSTGDTTWTPTLDQLGPNTLTLTGTDLAGNHTDQIFVVNVVDSYPPTAEFAVATGLSVTTEGSIISAPGPLDASVLLAENNATVWTAPGSQNLSIVVDLEGDLPQRIDRVTLVSPQQSQAARRFELRAGDSPTNVAPILNGELLNDAKRHTFTFAPTQAKVVELLILDNYGSPFQTSLLRLDVAGPPRMGGAVSYAAAGASVVRASPSHGQAPPSRLFDFDDPTTPSIFPTEWLATTVPANVVLDLAGDVRRIDFVRLRSEAGTPIAVKDFELRVSSTDSLPESFTTVFAGTLPADNRSHAFRFPATPARYVELIVRSVQGPTATQAFLYDLQVYAEDVGGRTISFEDGSSDLDGEIVSHRWSFGDGEISTESSPTHTYASPGSYRVTLEVTDDTELAGSKSFVYEALESPVADFGTDPLAPRDLDVVTVTDRSTSPNGPLLSKRFSAFGPRISPSGLSWTDSPHPLALWQGTYTIGLAVIDPYRLESATSRVLATPDEPAEVAAGPDARVYWGEPLLFDAYSVIDPADRDFQVCEVDWGDGFVEPLSFCGASGLHAYEFPGTYVLSLTAAEPLGERVRASSEVHVVPRPSSVVVLDARPAPGTGLTTVSARMLDGYASASSMEGRELVLSLGAVSATRVADVDGRIAVDFPFSATENEVRASFAGDTFYEPSDGSAVFPPATVAEPPLVAASPSRFRGHEFIMTSGPTGGERTRATHILVASEVRTVATIDMPWISVIHGSLEVRPGQLAVFEVPDLPLGIPGALRTIFKVTAPQDVAVWVETDHANDGASELVAPVSTLGTEYVVVNGNSGSWVQAIATEDDTTVTFVPTAACRVADGPSLVAGQVHVATLQRYQTIQCQYLSESSPRLTFTGSTFSADKPIAVFAGGIPSKAFTPDTQFEHLPSIDRWGTSFVVQKANRQSLDRIRMVAAFDGTEVRVNGAVYALLGRAQSADLLLDAVDTRAIVATQPILVAHVEVDPSKTSDEPMLALVPPVEQLVTSAFGFTEFTGRFSLAPGFDFDDLQLVAPTGSVGSVLLDGAPVTAAWVPDPILGYSMANVTLPLGLHRLDSLSPAVLIGGVSMGYGFGSAHGTAVEWRLNQLGRPCVPAAGAPGDLNDDDCDGRIDEELANVVD
ncbi:MAG: PKD domain-containing protein, partial [Deltaproteobacteria bacterium]|nr:PKD domain-containing protein [Deltaproteobacteria bacterium]